MKRIIILVLLLSVVFVMVTNSLLPEKNIANFYKGIVYVLLKDEVPALTYLNTFFRENQDPALRSIFEQLIRNNSFEVTKRFKRYLDINHRSTTALVGIALSITDMKVSTSIGNLERAQRLDRSFSVIYLCLGAEYMKQGNYPRAESYYNQALRYSYIPEYKILLAKLQFLKNDPGNVLRLMKPEADRHPDNFYFNYYTAKAYYQLGRVDDMRKYIETATEVNPGKKDAQLLKAQYLLAKNQLKQAQAILKRLRFKKYNEDYSVTYGHVLLKLNDRKTKSVLDEVYARNSWNKDINRLIALYYAKNKRGMGNIQNWIIRSILSGNPIDQLKTLLPGKYAFPEYKYVSFFDVNDIQWISDDLLVVGGRKRSGDAGQLFFIQSEDLKVIKSFAYQGVMQKISPSEDRKKLIFATTSKKGLPVYLYAVEILERSINYKQLHAAPLPLPSVAVGYNKAGSLAYITDSLLAKLAFESPFAIVPQIGERTYIYESYPFPIYVQNFATGEFGILDMSWLAKVPIPCVKKYYAVFEAAGLKSNIQKLIEKGQKLDLTSSEIVKIYFANDLASFIIYLSDLTNAFQAIIFESFNNRILNIDETMFLGEDEYAEVELLNFDPWTKEILLTTKDENRTLIHFNYRTYIYIHPTDKVCEKYYDKKANRLYVLTERSKKGHFTETKLEIISFKPYSREIVDARRDLEKIHFNTIENDVYLSSFTGEWLRMDNEYKFHYLGPSFEGCLHAISPSRKKTAAFINGRLFLLDGPVKEYTIASLSKPAKPTKPGAKSK
ncbi:MAG: tetratricopeptide repeat protein [Candidatus Aminicenantes bacterium]|nr:tetratricopeptide repeat protein [Candidatus Aminicenantes bacterium]NIM83772.1 tetratricopeptide repeat protein [Candidatus Aminicenantes bacterium]NIN23232.1 tetratricopeptide repeat protein [Candidatus Aminicenantes bacterium]NIN46926.1 tetratricopeptide repeat protein [Candidatus Aminicenantes bacterium]NIN89848.1 tetratricopeptide repeat protein [Candidatus Aminicenantes bacterium]